MNKFCVMTTGRAGSTSFMDALAQYHDIAVPNKQVDCVDHEIIAPGKPDKFWREYATLAGLPVNDETSLVQAFYASNATARFAGFKTMPNRHRHLRKILAAHEPQMICLYRRDVASTVASFIIARDQRSWRRSGEPQAHRFAFTKKRHAQVDAHLYYLTRCMNLIAGLPGAIRIAFEDLCDPVFADPALGCYFERAIRLLAPRPPVHGSGYVENWREFANYVAVRLRSLQQSAAQQ